MLTPVENSAFNELARQLAERLDSENGAAALPPADTPSTSAPPSSIRRRRRHARIVSEQPSWLTQPEPPARGETRRDKALLDLLPVGVLIYRLDRLLYANRAFLAADGLCRACTRWKRPAASTRSMSNPACPTPAAPRIPARR